MTEPFVFDSYKRAFGTFDEMMGFIDEFYRTGRWSRTSVEKLTFIAIPGETEERNLMAMASGLATQVMQDTYKNTGLVIKSEGGYIPVRTSAIKTILERVKVNGTSLSKLDKPTLAAFLNACAKVAGGNALVREVASKVSAIHGGDTRDYKILSMDDVFNTAQKELTEKFPDLKYIGGYFDHNVAWSRWRLTSIGDDSERLRKYRHALLKLRIQSDEFVPIVSVETSDTGCSGANIKMLMEIPGYPEKLRFCDPIKLQHRDKSTIEEFQKNMRGVYAQIEDAFQNIAALAGVTLRHPSNALHGIMKKIKIPKTYGAEVFENSKHYLAPGATAYECYALLGDVLIMVKEKAKTMSTVVEYEERIARAVTLDWTEYDVPGDYQY